MSTFKDRNIFKISNLRGVDFSSDPTLVAPYRASKMKNLIIDGGLLKKRKGWKTICKFGSQINGIWNFDYNKELIIQVETNFYRIPITSSYISEDQMKLIDFELDPGEHGTVETLKINPIKRPQAICNGEKLYIFGGGEYLVYGEFNGTWKIKRVRDIAYIPTTTIAIDNDSVEEKKVHFLESVNLLSRFVKNTLIGARSGSTWTVDSEYIKPNTDIKISVEKYDQGELKTINIVCGTGTSSSDRNLLYYANQPSGSNLCGSVDRAKGKITLNIDTMPYGSSPNIEVTFDPGYEKKSALVCAAQTGILFGAEGKSNQLFLANGNYECWSDESDFTYFPDTNISRLGTDSASIIGYQRLTDGTLAIFKSNETNEASIYYRSGTYRSNADGISVPAFTTLESKCGEGPVSDAVIANFMGDNLIVSQNGIFAVETTSNLSTNERRTVPRSRLINADIKHRNMKESASTTFENRYYLAVDGICYVADADYKFSDSGSYNYEWFVWDNIPARVWGKIDGHLAFGTQDGRLCVFDEEEYTDRDITVLADGNITADPSGTSVRRFTHNTYYNIENGDTLTFLNSPAIQRTLNLIPIYIDPENGKYPVKESNGGSVFKLGRSFQGIYPVTANIEEGMICRVYMNGVSGIESNKQYSIVNIDRENATCQLLRKDSLVKLDPQDDNYASTIIQFNCYEDLKIKTLGNDQFELYLYSGKEAYPIEYFINDVANGIVLKALVTHRTPITAQWYSATLDLGNNTLLKNLMYMTVVSRSTNNSKVIIGYDTRLSSNQFNSYPNKGGLNLDDSDFNEFVFDRFEASDTIRLHERNVNYIRFKAVFEGDGDASLCEMSIVYKQTKRFMGVK